MKHFEYEYLAHWLTSMIIFSVLYIMLSGIFISKVNDTEAFKRKFKKYLIYVAILSYIVIDLIKK